MTYLNASLDATVEANTALQLKLEDSRPAAEVAKSFAVLADNYDELRAGVSYLVTGLRGALKPTDFTR